MAQIILDWNPEILVRIPRRRKYIYRICTYFDFRILGTDKHIGLRFTYASHLAYASIWTDYSKSLFGLWLSKCQNSITCILYRRHQSVVACYFYPELSTTSKIGKRQHFFFKKDMLFLMIPTTPSAFLFYEYVESQLTKSTVQYYDRWLYTYRL